MKKRKENIFKHQHEKSSEHFSALSVITSLVSARVAWDTAPW